MKITAHKVDPPVISCKAENAAEKCYLVDLGKRLEETGIKWHPWSYDTFDEGVTIFALPDIKDETSA